MELLDGPLPMPILTCEEGLPFTDPCSEPAYTVRGGTVEEEVAPAEDDRSDRWTRRPIGRRRPGAGERLLPVSGMRREGGDVVPSGWQRHPVLCHPLHSEQ